VDGQTDGQSAMLNAARLSTDVTDASIAPSPFLSAECWKINQMRREQSAGHRLSLDKESNGQSVS